MLDACSQFIIAKGTRIISVKNVGIGFTVIL